MSDSEHPVEETFRVSNQVDDLDSGNLLPVHDIALGYFLRTGRIRIRSNEIQVGTRLQALDPEFIGGRIEDYLPFNPPVILKVRSLGPLKKSCRG